MSLTDEQHEELMRGKSTLAYGRAIESATAAPLLERIQELEESERSSERARVKLCSIHQYQKEALIARIAELKLENAELVKALEEARKDAERYQAIRSGLDMDAIVRVTKDPGMWETPYPVLLRGEELDAAIDAAIEENRK